MISLVPEVRDERIDRDVFPLSLLRKYAGKWSYIWREIDGFGER